MRPGIVVFVLLLLALSGALLFFQQTRPMTTSPLAAADSKVLQAANSPATAGNADGERRATNEIPSSAISELPDRSDPPIPNGSFLQLKVIIQGTQQPLPGANVRVSTSDRPATSPGDKFFTTGANGIVNIPRPENDPSRFVLQIDRDGFAGWWSAWNLAKGEKIPPQHTVALERATLIGGSVIDESARPIPDASVRIGRVWRGSERMDRSGQRQDIRTLTVKTDLDGKWTHHQVPADLLEQIQITVSHPDYAETRKMVDADSAAELRSLTWTATLRRGERIAGLVVDTNQSPVAGAEVSFGMRFSANRKETTSDASGRYELKNVSTDPLARDNMVIVMAKGFAPASQSLTNRNAQGELNFTLQAGAVIRGRVQNAQGDPLKNVTVSRERSSILDDDGIVWSAKTDDEGRFEWDGSPSQPQRFYFGAAGYTQIRNQSLAPGPTEHLIVLQKRRSLKGSVLNANTGDAIPKFFVLPARGTTDRLSSYSLSSEVEFKNGLFDLELSEAEHNVVRIRAPGYLTAIFSIPSENVSLDATLKPSASLAGLIVDNAGHPMDRAEVAAIGSENRGYATLGKGRFTPGRVTVDHTTTDANGRFKLDLSAEAESIVAVHPDGGFAESKLDDFEAKKELRLLPWGRLEGTLLSNGIPFANEPVALHNLGPASSGFNTDLGVFKATTDQQGRFTFEKVPPRVWTLSRLIRIEERSFRFGDKTNLTVTSGNVTFFEFVVP